MHKAYAVAIALVATLGWNIVLARPAEAAFSIPTCIVSVSPLQIGAYNTFRHTATVTPVTLEYSCTGGSERETERVVRFLSNGSAATQRYMVDASGDRLYYQICLDPTCQAPVGPQGMKLGAGAERESFDREDGAHGSITLYGVIAPLQNVGVGNYTDKLQVSIDTED